MHRHWLTLAGMIALCATGLVAPSGAHARTFFVFFELRDRAGGADADSDIYLQRLTTDGETGWTGRPAPVGAASGDDYETAPAACSDGAGGAILVYEYRFREGENAGATDICAQRIGPDGQGMWNEGTEPVAVAETNRAERRPVVLGDGAGGVFVVYEVQQADGKTDVVAQRIDGQGKRLWGEGRKPVVVGASAETERDAVVVPDGQGGIIVLFEWADQKGDVDAMAQRISAAGKALWNEGKQAVDIAATDALERHVAAIADGAGGAIAVFEYEPTTGQNKGDVDIMAQRLSAEGKPMWNEARVVGGAEGREQNPVALSDGQGGVIAAFDYTPLKGDDAGDCDILAQRLDGQGAMMWNEGKKSSAVSSAKALERAVQGLALGGGEALFVLEMEAREGERKGDCDIMAQRVAADGKMVWNEGKRSTSVCTTKWLEKAPLVLSDGAGGAVVIMTATGPKGEFEGDQDLEASRLSPDGQLLWNNGEKPVDISAGKTLESNPCAVVVAD